MDKRQAQELVSNTLQNDFDKDRFLYFIKNLLNNIDDSKAFYARGYVSEAYKSYVKTYERLATYTDPFDSKIDILVVYLQKETSLERARTAQRNFVARYLKDRGEKEAGLVAFVSPDLSDWRFSLVKMEYKFIDGKLGKAKVKEEFTPAKRWSFLVGKHESSHTAQSKLWPIIANDEANPALQDLENAFNIEKVTKEFFEKYRGLFADVKEALDKILAVNTDIRNDFAEKSVSPVDFSKKLLGQIVFLYFLQKKGWFGVERDEGWGTGPKNFLRMLFEKRIAQYDNFFNDILEPLFYEALAVERSDDFYSRFNCKIPFLNGGLFDPLNNYDWIHTDILLPNNLFSNSDITKEGDKGTGILDIFDRYNFTVKEDEPLEKEVAVDPEMLGKVFENLLEVKDRKSKGTYYTPREIVHYMCQQSLVNYLVAELSSVIPSEARNLKDDIETLIKYGETSVEHDVIYIKKKSKDANYKGRYDKPKLPKSIEQHAKLIDEKLASIRVCDPAVGSGAFPVGMMNEVIRTRNALTPYIPPRHSERSEESRTPYNFKRHCIQNSLYGVDIDPGAVEIAKLRLWLSLVVDEEERETIKPLPNLDYKIVCGNSLLGVEKNLFNAGLFNELEKLKPLFFNETSGNKKKEYKIQIDEIIGKLTNGHKDFDFEIYFSEVFHEKKGFDVVIGNPPYGFRNVLTKKEKEYFRKIENIEFSSGDSAELFSKKCFNNLVRENGILTFIIPKKSLYGDAWEGFRRDYWLKYDLQFLLDASKAFQDVLLEANAFGLVKSNSNASVKCAYLTKNDEVFEFASGFKKDIFLKNLTAQIYKLLIPPTLWDKIEEQKVKEKLVEGKLGLAIGTDFFSGKETEYKLLKGIDIGRWRIKSYRWLKNISKLNLDTAKQFLKPKIVTQVIVAHIENPKPHIKITACFDEEGIIITNTLMSFELDKRIDPKFWLGYLNSSFISWYAYNFIYARAIRTMHFYDFYIQQIPIPNEALPAKAQKSFIEIVDKILAITKSADYLQNEAKQKKVKEYERQIDEMVYKLYGLTPEEIKIVENSNKKL